MDNDSNPHKIGPWTRLASKEVYRNPWIHLREDQIRHPDGTPGIYGVVEFQNLAVGVIPVDEQGRVILVGQFRYPMNSYSWEIPEGGCPKGEAILVGAMRELREETGFTAARWDYLGSLALSNAATNEMGHLFLARDLMPGVASPEPSEELQVKKMDLEEAYRLAMEGELTESLTVAGLARTRYFLDSEKVRPLKISFPEARS